MGLSIWEALQKLAWLVISATDIVSHMTDTAPLDDQADNH